MARKYVYVKKRYVFLFTIVDFLGSVIFKICRFFRRPQKSLEIKKIVVLELAHIGDAVAIIPALRLLRKKFPKSSITAVVGPWAEEVLTGNPDINEVITHRAWGFDRAQKSPFLAEAISLIKFLRAGNFDLGIDTRGDFRAILLMWLGKIKKRVSYGFAGGAFLLTEVMPFDISRRQDKHQAEHNLNLIASIKEGVQSDERDLSFKIFFSDEDSLYIDRLLKEKGVTGGDFLIAMHLGAGLPTKRWPIERFSQLIERILRQYDVKIILIGSKGESDLAKSLELGQPLRLIDLIGKTTLKQLAALLKRCNLFVGADSGVMHIAATQNTPIIVIWGGQNKPSHWRPLADEVTIIHKTVDCSPCGLKHCRELKCLKAIEVQEVFEAVEKQITRLRGR
ncbi:MAG: glycosyltransferase family 9 protein [Candidatus Omnitrophota bacterium]|nr:glycosyltransferase family 9 protein [Candidatus Omnitrophota bacterium]